jgi:hypothetical protein
MARLRRGVRRLYALARFEADAWAALRFATS